LSGLRTQPVTTKRLRCTFSTEDIQRQTSELNDQFGYLDLKRNSTSSMHAFPELIDDCAAFTLGALSRAQDAAIEAMQTSGATVQVKALQMTQLQRVVSAVGMFSIFDAMLQTNLQCADGFKRAGELLDAAGESALKERFDLLRLAVNVLKHGSGRSYDDLLAQAEQLPFRLKRRGESFFDEGDVSEVATLIEVDDRFVLSCAETIRDVWSALQR
jgi:hypothetical protein